MGTAAAALSASRWRAAWLALASATAALFMPMHRRDRERKLAELTDALAEAERNARRFVDLSLDPVLLCDSQRCIEYANPAAAALLQRLGHAQPLGRRFDSLLGAEPQALWLDRLWGQPGELPYLAATLKPLQGPPLPVALRVASYRDGAQMRAQIVIRDLSDLRDHETAMSNQLRFNKQLIEAVPLPLSLRDPEGRFLLVNRAFELAHETDRERVVGRTVFDLLPAGAAGEIARHDAQALHSSAPIDFDARIEGPRGRARSVQIHLQSMRRLDASLIGVVAIETDVTAIRDKEADLAETSAQMERMSVRLIEAQEAERRRIARDLHDQVGQILTALKIQLASIARHGEIEAYALLTPTEMVEEALRQTRDLTASLHPHLLDDLGLEPALRWLIERFIRPSVGQVDLRCKLDPVRGAAATELVAFRVVQEALTNVLRHAQATRAGVMLEAYNGSLSIEVLDDGDGFEAGNTWFDMQRSTSVGVASMRGRVAELGGELHIESTPGSGTRLRAVLPW